MLAIAFVGLAAAVLFLQTAEFGLLGFDTYPLILTSRVESWSDFVGTFSQELMEGRYPGDFYRPVLNLTFACDYAIWKLDPRGYQFTNILLFGCSALTVFGVAQRLLGGCCRLAPFVALVVFLLHPTHFEVIPVPARRPEMLACTFMGASLIVQLSPRALAMRRPALLPVVPTVLAIMSKETAYMTPVLVLTAVVLYSTRANLIARVRHAAASAAPHVVAVGALLAARYAVLGGIGGHANKGFSVTIDNAWGVLVDVVNGVFLPQPTMQTSAAKLILVIMAAGAGLTIALTWRRRDDRGSPDVDRLPLKGAIVGGTWVLACTATYVAVGSIEAWYLFLAVGGWGVIVGGFVETLVCAARVRARTARGAAVFTLVLLCVQVGWVATYSPLFRRYDEWRRATAASERFLRELEIRVVDADPGSLVMAPPIPEWVEPKKTEPTVFGAAVLWDYSVQAWLELTLPHLNARVQPAGTSVVRRNAEEIVVVLTRRLDAF